MTWWIRIVFSDDPVEYSHNNIYFIDEGYQILDRLNSVMQIMGPTQHWVEKTLCRVAR